MKRLIYEERERFRSTQAAALRYLEENPPTNPEHFFHTIKEWFSTLESMFSHYIKAYKKVIRIIEQAETVVNQRNRNYKQIVQRIMIMKFQGDGRDYYQETKLLKINDSISN